MNEKCVNRELQYLKQQYDLRLALLNADYQRRVALALDSRG